MISSQLIGAPLPNQETAFITCKVPGSFMKFSYALREPLTFDVSGKSGRGPDPTKIFNLPFYECPFSGLKL